jgi:hypothetical protein
VSESFDRGERSGVYLKPMLRTARGEHSGGALVSLERAGTRSAFEELDVALRGEREPAVFTPPIYAGDAVRGTTNPLFAVRALREFIELCLQFGPSSRRPH